jgi:TolC family type I secretion outer membrane protein
MLHEVINHHPQLQAERESLEVTKTGVYEAYSGFLPTAVAGYDKGKQQIKFNNLPKTDESTTNKQLTVTQPIFNGGGTIAQIGAAEAREEAGTYRLKQVSQEILLRAITAYADVSEKQEVLLLAHEKVTALTHHLDGTQKQYKAGELTVTDIAQSEARLARAEADLRDAQAALEAANATYKRETGLEAAQIDHMPPLPVTLPKTEQEIMRLVANHPALITAKENERAADYTIDQRTATLLPQVNIEGQLNNSNRTSQPGLSEVDQRAVMLQVKVPIFQSGAEYARIKEAKHEYARAKNQTSDINRQVLEAAIREWHDFNASSKIISAYAQSIAAAEKALRSVEAERMAGTRTVLDVLNAQEEVYSSKIAMLRAKTRYVVGSYRLLVATGILSEAVIPANA